MKKECQEKKKFLFGVSTAAAQIEGGAAEDGRSPSIWDTFSAQPHKMQSARFFPTACDSYHRFERDLKNLKQLGVDSYRMSISWSRVLPEGTGALNQKGMDYYKYVFESLLGAGIVPNVTLYHWDLPQCLEEKGGWANRDAVGWFGEYAAKMFREFSRLVPLWATVNEPIATYIGYAKGTFAPGHRDERLGNQARHNLLVAHGRGVQAFRAEADKKAQIGIVIDVWKRYPRTDAQIDLDTVRDEDERNWKFYTDPVLGGSYSPYILEELEREGTLMEIRDGDLEEISRPLDFFGLNIYNRVLISREKRRKGKLLQGGNVQEDASKDYPKVVYDVVKMLREMYDMKIPIYVTENGKATYVHEFHGLDGMIHDRARIRYMDDFLSWIRRANEDGLDIRGYYAWSLMDNFEWAAGTWMKYGLLETNFRTFETKWKESAYFYRDYIRAYRTSADPCNITDSRYNKEEE